jgi:hypothetical protein
MPVKLTKQWLWGAVLCLVSNGCTHTPSPTIIGKWRWAGTWHAESGFIPPEKKYGEAIHQYKTDSTYDVYRDGKLALQDQPFSIRRGRHPDGSTQPVDFFVNPDGKAADEYQLVWISGKANDTLVFMLLDPGRGYKPYVSSTYVRTDE